ncbi:hypothetical protein EDB92DRAFT_1874193 [Lactarius akahatsu]|uniref:Uncharacterized protein n=1 Tax=Lactarius akahatsu TaxID=416441 RepID=A0AAD4LBG1_9AGAM|nr:hypothetical protein EDB92DRAFT_1874193 [Lactarius akahatsu]
MSSRPSKAFANFFSDDTATDISIYYPSMHDHLQGLNVAATLLPRRKLKRLLILSMLMTLGMALLSVYSTHILSRLGLVALWQHYDDVTNSLLVQISTQLLAAGLIDNSTVIPFPRPPQSCKLNTPLCNISLPWLYGSVISLSCAFGVLQTLSKVRNDRQEHAREIRTIRLALTGAVALFALGILEHFL